LRPATKRLLVGRRIVDVKLHRFSRGGNRRPRWTYLPILTLDNGAELSFTVDELESRKRLRYHDQLPQTKGPHPMTINITDGLNGAAVIAHDTRAGTTYVRLPHQLQRTLGRCDCPFCKAHPQLTPTWDTLAIPTSGTAWTVHMPDPHAFRQSIPTIPALRSV
jgi:hypothetical protein